MRFEMLVVTLLLSQGAPRSQPKLRSTCRSA